jgi:glycosyltransferase involved in cell wall biosynthesis
MRIAILTQYFPPETGAPQARLFELATRLGNRGHEITVLTAMPNYPTGKVFDDYRWRLFSRERLDGIRVLRTPILPSKSKNLLVRLISYMSFVVTSFLIGTWRLGRQDILVVESPPLFLALSGVPMSRWLRAPMLLMVSDIWPDVAIRMGDIIGQRQQRILEKLEAWVYRKSACVALTNPGAVAQVQDRFPDVSCSVISNGVDTSVFTPALGSEQIRRELGIEDGQFAVGYCGLHGIFQGLDVVVRAAELLRKNPRIRIVMVGDGPTKSSLVAQAQAAELDNIIFHPKVPKDQMPAILASLDASLIPLAAALPGTMPSKVYEALAAGVPMIVTAGCEAEQLVHRYNVGRLFDAGDDEQLAYILQELSQDNDLCAEMRGAAIKLAPRFDRDKIAAQTEGVLEAVANKKPIPQVDW